MREAKPCGVCGEVKPLDAFHRQRSSGDGRQRRCKQCESARARTKDKQAYHAKHREQRVAYLAEWRAQNPEKAKAVSARWAAANPERVRSNNAAWRKNNPDRRFELRLRSEYGLSLEDYMALSARQDGRCAICREEPRGSRMSTKRLHVDHCHATGAVRGLLCGMCNLALGGFEDDPALLRRAIAYVERANARDQTRVG